jgi:hypothetical protein
VITKTYLFLSAILLLSVGCGQSKIPLLANSSRPSPSSQVPEVLVPDTITRSKADKIDVNAIKDLVITGSQFMRFADDPIVIKDKTEISGYITALRHAECQGDVGSLKGIGIANGVNQLQIDFLSRKGQEIDSQIFCFNLFRDVDCFGPEFRKKMLALQGREGRQDVEVPARHTP